MAITCAFNTSVSTLDFKYCLGRKTGTSVANISNAVDAGAIGGRSVVFDNSAVFQQLVWDGAMNLPNSRIISVLIRFAPDYTGTPSGRRVIWGMGNCVGGTNPGHLELYHDLTTGNLVAHARNESGTAAINFGSFGAWSPTQDVWYDIVFVWDGTTTANAVKLYIDAALFGQQTAAAALTASWTNLYRRAINVGATITGTTSDAKMNEFVVFDTAIDPTANVNLESGAGLLNGASRTSFVSDVAGATLTTLDSLLYTVPADSHIRSGETVVRAGVTGSPSLVVPTLANTKTGVAGDGGTGTYDGTDRHTHPTEAQVQSGIQWKDNSTTNNKTGSLSASGGGGYLRRR